MRMLTGSGGQVVDSVTQKPVVGNVIVAQEKPDGMGIDSLVSRGR